MNFSEMYKNIVYMDSEPIIVMDLNHTILYMNKKCIERYSHRGGEALVGRNLLDFHSDESKIKIEKFLEKMLKEDLDEIYLYFHKRDKKELYMVAIRDDNNKIVAYYERFENPLYKEDKGC